MGRSRDTVRSGPGDDPEPNEFIAGTIKRLVRDRGFGFIRADTGKEYFFHRSEVEGFEVLDEGDRVEFVPVQSHKGPRAQQIRIGV